MAAKITKTGPPIGFSAWQPQLPKSASRSSNGVIFRHFPLLAARTSPVAWAAINGINNLTYTSGSPRATSHVSRSAPLPIAPKGFEKYKQLEASFLSDNQ